MGYELNKPRAPFNNYDEKNAKFRATENEIANYMANDTLPGSRPFKATHGDRYKRSTKQNNTDYNVNPSQERLYKSGSTYSVN